MRSIVAAVVLLLAAGSPVGATESVVVRDAAPAAVIAQFSQAIPPEPPVVGELPGQPAAGSGCCRKHAARPDAKPGRTGGPCACCQKIAPRASAKGR